MKVLALDTALGAASACVLAAGENAPIAAETLLMERGHAEALLPLIERVMARVPDGFGALDRIAVTVGPGSFTGIRVGIAAARAIGLACEAPVVGVSVLAALAAPLLEENSSELIVPAIDARHGNVFFQLFSGAHALSPPHSATLKEAVRAIGSGPIRLIGSGAAALASEAQRARLRAEVAALPAAPEIVYVARLGLAAEPDAAPPRPLYLKAPDARPQEEGRIPRL